jgi:hypothetical protein
MLTSSGHQNLSSNSQSLAIDVVSGVLCYELRLNNMVIEKIAMEHLV